MKANKRFIFEIFLLIMTLICVFIADWHVANYFLILYAIEVFREETRKNRKSVDLIWYFIGKVNGVEFKEVNK